MRAARGLLLGRTGPAAQLVHESRALLLRQVVCSAPRVWSIAAGAVRNVSTSTSTTTASSASHKHSGSGSLSCRGCGVKIQTVMPQSMGFAPEETVVDKHPLAVLCQRCYQMKHYGKLVPLTVPPDGFRGYLDAIKPLDVLIVYVLDLFDLSGSIIPDLDRHVGGKDVMVVVNKSDILPKDANFGRIRAWIGGQLRQRGIRGLVDVHFVSALQGDGMRKCSDAIETHRFQRDVYVIGAANVGKSTFINKLLKIRWEPAFPKAQGKRKVPKHGVTLALDELPAGFQEGDIYTGDLEELRRMVSGKADPSKAATHDDLSKLPSATAGVDLDGLISVQSSTLGGGNIVAQLDPKLDELLPNTPEADARRRLTQVPLTTSPLPGTTLGILSAPLGPQGSLFDTPGIILDAAKQSLLEGFAAEGGTGAVKRILPKEPIKAITYRLKPGKSLFLGGLVRIDYTHPVEEVGMLFTWFGLLPAHMTSTDTADELFQRHLSGEHGLLQPSGGPLVNELTLPLKNWYASAGGGRPVSAKATEDRRRKRFRQSAVDIVVGGFGWVIVTPIEIQGMHGWDRAMQQASIRVQSAAGCAISAREPMLPFETSGTRPSDWEFDRPAVPTLAGGAAKPNVSRDLPVATKSENNTA